MITLWRAEFVKKSGKNIDEIRDILSERILEKVLTVVKTERLDKSDVKDVLWKIVEGTEFDEAIKIEKVDDREIEEEIRKIVKTKPGLRPNAYMGLVMAKFKGKLDAKKAMEIINRIVGEE